MDTRRCSNGCCVDLLGYLLLQIDTLLCLVLFRIKSSSTARRGAHFDPSKMHFFCLMYWIGNVHSTWGLVHGLRTQSILRSIWLL